MTKRKATAKTEADVSRIAGRIRRRRPGPKRKPIKPWDWSFAVPKATLQGKGIRDFYRPLKKPVTLRLDADVLEWFKKKGRRYQTRINAALRKVMLGELKKG